MSVTYIPGVCNIGPAEIKLRRRTGLAGLVLTIVLFTILMVANLSVLWRLLMFIPAALAAVGYLQAGLHFCVGFGQKGLFNVSDDVLKHETVENAEYRRQDQRKARLILGLAVAIGIVVTAAVFILP